MKTIGEKIKEAREKKGLSQAELADKLGYKSRSSVNKIEVGGRDIPRSQIVKIANILNVTPAFLMGWEEEKPAPTDDENELLKVVKELNAEYKYTDSQISRIASYMRFVGNEDSSEE